MFPETFIGMKTAEAHDLDTRLSGNVMSLREEMTGNFSELREQLANQTDGPPITLHKIIGCGGFGVVFSGHVNGKKNR